MSAIVVMGPAGAGKTSIGSLLAHELGWIFIDADDLHSAANIAKMAGGDPLSDEDRHPWLHDVGLALREGTVIACSALRRDYRDRIRRNAPDAVFVALDGSRELLASRMSGRAGHFMPTALLDSQLRLLEPLGSDEAGITVGIEPSQSAIVDDVLARLSASGL